MKTLIMTVGLPRSGKTTWAKEQNLPIVCPDAIRLALHGERFIQLAEPFVWAIAKVMVRALFLAGHDKVILDATNTTEKRRSEWIGFHTVIQFFTASKEECIRRARLDGDETIVPVIERMAEQFQFPTQEEVKRLAEA